MSSLNGDVSSTLLELLNPEQSNKFRDDYLDIEFDFSQCIFICTSNSNVNMLAPLLDRIEVINVPAYLPVEKMNIAKNYLIPKFEKEYAFNEGNLSNEKIEFTDASIMQIVNQYCGSEAGVRHLRKCIDRVFRKIVTKLEMKSAELKVQSSGESEESESEAAGVGHHWCGEIDSSVREYQVNTHNLERFLDVTPVDEYYYQNINKELPVGTANGLAYVDDGFGAILKISFVKKIFGKYRIKEAEEEDSQQREGSMTHTGRLGDVMKESLAVAQIAVFNYVEEKKLNALVYSNIRVS